MTKNRHRLAARQPLRDRPGAGRPESGVGVRPVRFDPHRGAAGRRADGAGHSVSHRAPFTPESQTRNPTAPPKPSGIDYAQLIETAHAAELARGVNYTALTGAADQIPGQLDLLTGQEAQPK